MLELEEQNRNENLAGTNKDPPQEKNDQKEGLKSTDDKIDEVFWSLGGFSTYQWLLLFSCFCYNKSVMLVMVSLGFLEKVPNEYFCTYEESPENEISCKPEDFCEDPTVLSFRPNMDLNESYINWISHYKLTCTSGGYIGLIASSFFIGWISTLVFIPRISDLFGRQRFIQFGNVIQSIGYSLLFMTRNYNVLIIAMVTMGMCSTVRT